MSKLRVRYGGLSEMWLVEMRTSFGWVDLDHCVTKEMAEKSMMRYNAQWKQRKSSRA